MSMVSAGLGLSGLGFVTFGCCCGIFSLLGVPLGLAGLIIGYLERGKVKAGEVDPASDTWALVGMITGGICTALGVLFGVLAGIGLLANFSKLLQELKDNV